MIEKLTHSQCWELFMDCPVKLFTKHSKDFKSDLEISMACNPLAEDYESEFDLLVEKLVSYCEDVRHG